MQIEETLINDRLRVLRSILKTFHCTYLQFYSNLPVEFAILLKSSLPINSFHCLF